MFWLKGCSRCGGDLYREEDIYGKHVCCLQCGRDLTAAQATALGSKAKARPATAAVSQRRERQRVA